MDQGMTGRPEISHAALIPHGTYRGWILMWHSPQPNQPMQSVLWDPSNPDVVFPLQQTLAEDLFCSGASFDLDGQLVVVGGNPTNTQLANSSYRFFPGLLGALVNGGGTCPSTLEVAGSPWIFAGQMSLPRYYPTVLALVLEGIPSPAPFTAIGSAAAFVLGGGPNFQNGNNAVEIWQALRSQGSYDWSHNLVPATNGIGWGAHQYLYGTQNEVYACLPTANPPEVLMEWYPRAVQLARSGTAAAGSVCNILVTNDVSGHVQGPANQPGSTWVVKPPYLSAQNPVIPTWQLHRAASSNTASNPNTDRYYGNLGYWIFWDDVTQTYRCRVLVFNGQHLCATGIPNCTNEKCLTGVVQEFVIGNDPANPQNSTWQKVDLSSPSVPPGQGVIHPRVHANLVILPTGEALILGGEKQSTASGAAPCDLEPAFEPELYTIGSSPAASASALQMATTPAQATGLPPYPRGYHSLGVLLQDGRVLLAGGEYTSAGDSRFTGEIFSPPYLGYAWTRPLIRSAAAEAIFAQTFQVVVQFDDDSQFDRAVLLRPASVTHHFDVDQRYIELPVVGNEPMQSPPGVAVRRLTLRAPTADAAPPGYYMLWVVGRHNQASAERAPSVAHYMRLRG
jgi:hypothetical protein